MAIWLAPPHPTHKNARARQESACPSVLGGTDRVGAAQHPKPLIQKSRVAGHMPRTFFALRFASAPSFEATSKPPTTVVPSTLHGWHPQHSFSLAPTQSIHQRKSLCHGALFCFFASCRSAAGTKRTTTTYHTIIPTTYYTPLSTRGHTSHTVTVVLALSFSLHTTKTSNAFPHDYESRPSLPGSSRVPERQCLCRSPRLSRLVHL